MVRQCRYLIFCAPTLMRLLQVENDSNKTHVGNCSFFQPRECSSDFMSWIKEHRWTPVFEKEGSHGSKSQRFSARPTPTSQVNLHRGQHRHLWRRTVSLSQPLAQCPPKICGRKCLILRGQPLQDLVNNGELISVGMLFCWYGLCMSSWQPLHLKSDIYGPVGLVLLLRPHQCPDFTIWFDPSC